MNQGFRNGDTVSQQTDLENSLLAVLKARFGQKFIEPKWKMRNFGFYTDNVDFPKIDVVTATNNVAVSLNLKLRASSRKGLQNLVSLNSTPNDLLPHMNVALDVAEPAVPV